MCYNLPIRIMKNIIRLVVFLILSWSVYCNLPNCPSSCNCSAIDFTCMDCIRHFHRGMTAESGGCICIGYFIEKKVQHDYCCPYNCTRCDIRGCLTCPQNNQIYYNSHFKIYTCVCQPHYTQLGREYCYCMNEINSTQYYLNFVTNKCYKCPPGCVCNQTGCVQCQDPLRYIKVDPMMKSACPCRYPTKQNQTSCVCPKNCDCSNGQIACNASSNRKVENGQWSCKYPYVQQDFQCKCKDPYYELQVIPGIKECVCGSKDKITKFYEYGEGCYACPKGCQCNQRGCVLCDEDAHRVIVGFSCFCQELYIQHQGICVCAQPYYLDRTTGDCKCIAQSNPMGSFYNQQEVCQLCPHYCLCNASGCVYCSARSMRTVRKLNNNKFVCECPPSSYKFMTVCLCNAPYSFNVSNGTCVCLYGQEVYNDAGTCKQCPYGCICNATAGCYFCNSSSFRIPQFIAYGYLNCPCSQGYIQNQNFLCICKFPHVWNPATNTCVCPEPYAYKDSVGCVCRSSDDPSKYYIDALTNKCHICPVGCTCNTTGCHNCYPYSLRISILYGTSGRCPCLQNTTLFEDVCTVCPSNSYYFNGDCVECQGCSRCNVHGCTHCSSDSHLVLVKGKYRCQCTDTNKIFVRGECKCGKDLYLNFTSLQCGVCPKYCLDCKMQSSTIKCVTCVNSPSRRSFPADNCPCIDGYNQLGTFEAYCCPRTCSDCNSTGCTECPPQTFRTLVNQSCVCQGNMISTTGSIICICPYGQYMYLSQCLKCPPNCPSCVYSFTTQTVNCLECRSGVNRKNHTGNITTEGGCECEDQFAQLNPQQQYCYPKHCKKQTKVCEECEELRELARNGLQCRCMKGYYESDLEECEPCSMNGCLACLSLSYCISCNESKDYYLTNKTCKKNVSPLQTIYIQSLQGIYIQMKISGVSSINVTKYPVLFYYTARIEKIRKSQDIITPAFQDVDAITQSIFLSDNSEILHMIIENPTENFEDILLHLNVAYATPGALPVFAPSPGSRRQLYWIFSIMNSDGNFSEGIDEDIFIYKDKIYSSQVLGLQYQEIAVAQIVLSILFIFIAAILHFLSFKHNHLVFFMQTMSFICFVYNDPKLDVTPFLFNMRLSYLQVSSDISNLLGYNYLESTQGNFKFFTLDSNLLRVANLPIEITLVVLGMAGLLRIILLISEFKKQNWNKQFIIKATKKPIYRAIEFFYKLTMYPIIYFSIVNLHNWNAYTIVPGAQYYHNTTKGIAIGFIFLYAGITLFSVFFETISKVYKIQNAMEFLSDILASVILVSSYNNNVFISLIIIFITRTAIYLYTRKKYFRQFSNYQYIRILTLVFEICCVCLVTTNSITKLAPFILLTLLSHTIHSTITVVLSIIKWRIQHKGTTFTEEKEQTTENISDIKLPTENKSDLPEDQDVRSRSFLNEIGLALPDLPQALFLHEQLH